jgi:predicted nucleotidyltransferase
MLEELFSSKARAEVLALLFLNSTERFYQRQIAELTGLPIRAVQREVEKFSSLDLVTREENGNRIYYRANERAAIFPELKRLVMKTRGPAYQLRQTLQDDESIALAFIYGSWASGNETATSDLDLFVVGNLSGRRLSALMRGTRSILGREINTYLVTPEEYRTKVTVDDDFLRGVFNQPKVFIIGDEEKLRALSA